MQKKYARLITTINSARSHMVKVAEGEGFDVNKGKIDAAARGTDPNGNAPATAAGGAPRTSNPSLWDNLKGRAQFGIDYLRARPEQTMSAAIGALGGGAGAYLLAKLLKRKRAWMWGLGGAALAGAGGAAYGKQLYGTIKEYLAKRRAAAAAANSDAAGVGASNIPSFKEQQGIPTSGPKMNTMEG